MLDIQYVVKHNLCMGCGICSIDKNIVDIAFNKKNDCPTPQNTCLGQDSIAAKVCPGKGYNIVAKGQELYGKGKYDPMLGYFQYLTAAHTNDTTILKNASSGGVITHILIYLLEKGIVDKVAVTQFYCDRKGVHTRSFLTDSKIEILKSQGSKYCPVDLSGLLEQLHTYTGKVAIMATPCAIAGIRNIQEFTPDYIKSKIVFTIANFCGGFKSFKNIKRLAEIHKIDYYNLKTFRFRGEGQPGGLLFIENNGKTAATPYPQYVGLNGYSKMHRCFVCPDATGELADIACGDAWIQRFQEDMSPWSMIICRNKKAENIIKDMGEKGAMTLADVSTDEIKLSQRFNLNSKKTRQKARMSLYKILRKSIPEFDGGYNDKTTSLKTELNITFKHWLTLLAERSGLYMILYGRKKLYNKK